MGIMIKSTHNQVVFIYGNVMMKVPIQFTHLNTF